MNELQSSLNLFSVFFLLLMDCLTRCWVLVTCVHQLECVCEMKIEMLMI